MKATQFERIVPLLLGFAQQHHWEADARRRVSTARTEGFRLKDALHFLFESVPGLYKAGLSKDTVARFFEPPRKNTIAARAYKGLVDARVAPKRNNARKVSNNTHIARSQLKLLQE